MDYYGDIRIHDLTHNGFGHLRFVLAEMDPWYCLSSQRSVNIGQNRSWSLEANANTMLMLVHSPMKVAPVAQLRRRPR